MWKYTAVGFYHKIARTTSAFSCRMFNNSPLLISFKVCKMWIFKECYLKFDKYGPVTVQIPHEREACRIPERGFCLRCVFR